MADLVFTATSVVLGANARYVEGILGYSGAIMDQVYLDPADGKYKAAQCDDANMDAVAGALISISHNGQKCLVLIEDDDLTPGATLTVGVDYVLSAAVGKVAPVADLISTNYHTHIFFAKSTTKCIYRPVVTGAQKA